VVMMALFFEDDVDVADSDDGEDDNDWWGWGCCWVKVGVAAATRPGVNGFRYGGRWLTLRAGRRGFWHGITIPANHILFSSSRLPEVLWLSSLRTPVLEGLKQEATAQFLARKKEYVCLSRMRSLPQNRVQGFGDKTNMQYILCKYYVPLYISRSY
jgi:hypothetical protein